MLSTASVRELGAQVDRSINEHILFDVVTNTPEEVAFANLMRVQPDMCLSEALVVAYVLNNGLVMCSESLDDASHVTASVSPAGLLAAELGGCPPPSPNESVREQACLCEPGPAAALVADVLTEHAANDFSLDSFEHELDMLSVTDTHLL
jgi:hypothetical protein